MNPELLSFIKEHYNILLYLVTWIIAVARYRRYFDTVLGFFPIFIMYTFLTELLGYFVKFQEGFQFFSDDQYAWHNVIIYNIYSLVSFSFFFFIYWRTLKTPKYKMIVKMGAAISLAAYIISVFFQNPFHINLYYADLVASMALLVFIVLYFKEKQKESSPYPMKQNLLFWISLGLAVFHLFFPLIFVAAYEAPAFYSQFQLHKLLMFLIVAMYSLFIIGFLFSKRRAFR